MDRGLACTRLLVRKVGPPKRYAPETILHEVENVAAADNEEQLHHKVVYGDPAVQEVKITCDKNGDIECLSFERYAYARASIRVRRQRRAAHVPRHERVVRILCKSMKIEAK